MRPVADEREPVDVIVVGSGMGALCAAAACDALGLSVTVLEKDRYFGGATARSGAALWLPGSRQALAAGLADDQAEALAYLDALIGNLAPRDLREAFVRTAPEALAFFEDHSKLDFDLRQVSPDYYPELPHASTRGRVIDVKTFDGRRLGIHLAYLRPPIETHLLFGFMAINRQDLQLLLKSHRSLRGLWQAAGMVAGALLRRLRHGRDTRLVLGNALVARLACTLFERGIDLRLNNPVTELHRDAAGRVVGVTIQPPDKEAFRLNARKAVILGTGGFSANPATSARNRHATPAGQHVSMFPDSCTGDGIAMAQSAGAQFAEQGRHAFFWSPVSLHRMANGSIRRFAHLTTDRAKPGVIAVNLSGRRFTNEADAYHRFGEALQSQSADAERGHVAWLICDATALRRYGLGIAKPFPAHLPNARLVVDGYLTRAESIENLAVSLGLPAETLASTIADYNRDATAGEDTAFGKGRSAHNRPLGDPEVKPNPCLAPVAQPPFYAVAVHSGDLGTARGVRTDRDARALDSNGAPVPGLYAVGNDMHSLTGGTYPGPGITLGPALVFAYRAARHIATATPTPDAVQ